VSEQQQPALGGLVEGRVQHLTIRAAVHAVMCEVGYVHKRGEVKQGGGYKYAKEGDFIAAIRPAMLRHGLIGPFATDVKPGEVVRIDKADGKFEFMQTVHARYEYHHVDSGETLVVESAGAGLDTREKAIFKALTGALKYGLRQPFLIETGDDPEREGEDPGSSFHDKGGGLSKEEREAAYKEGFEAGASAGRTFMVRQIVAPAREGFDGRALARELKARKYPTFEQVKLFAVWLGNPKLAAWTGAEIVKFLDWMATSDGKGRWDQFCEACGIVMKFQGETDDKTGGSPGKEG
jgi:hypothetical protein